MARRRILILLRDREFKVFGPKEPKTAPTGHPEKRILNCQTHRIKHAYTRLAVLGGDFGGLGRCVVVGAAGAA